MDKATRTSRWVTGQVMWRLFAPIHLIFTVFNIMLALLTVNRSRLARQPTWWWAMAAFMIVVTFAILVDSTIVGYYIRQIIRHTREPFIRQFRLAFFAGISWGELRRKVERLEASARRDQLIIAEMRQAAQQFPDWAERFAALFAKEDWRGVAKLLADAERDEQQTAARDERRQRHEERKVAELRERAWRLAVETRVFEQILMADGAAFASSWLNDQQEKQVLLQRAEYLNCADEVGRLLNQGHQQAAERLVQKAEAEAEARRKEEARQEEARQFFAELTARIRALAASRSHGLSDQLARLRALPWQKREFRKALHALEMALEKAEEAQRVRRRA